LDVREGSSGIVFCRKVGNNEQTGIYYTPEPSTTAFTHVVVTSDGTTAQLYMNGVVSGAATIEGMASPAKAPFTWGAHSNLTSEPFFQGALDELAVYDKALTPAQVATHFFAGTGTQ
jgi:hypothetical protein